MVIRAKSFAKSDEWLLFNDRFTFDAQGFAAPAKPAAGCLLFF